MKKYQIIYADPPWEYNKRNRNDSFGGGVRTHYPVMSYNDLRTLPVPDICEENCMIFMWMTFPYLPKQLEIMKNWMFEYKTIGFIWVKLYPKKLTPCLSTGFYSKSNSEACFIGTRGKVMKPAVDNVSSVIISPRGKHSEKPIEVKKRIELMYPTQSKIELFARQKTEGWDVWGNEVKSDIQITPLNQ